MQTRTLADVKSALALAIAMRDRDLIQDLREELQAYKEESQHIETDRLNDEHHRYIIKEHIVNHI